MAEVGRQREVHEPDAEFHRAAMVREDATSELKELQMHREEILMDMSRREAQLQAMIAAADSVMDHLAEWGPKPVASVDPVLKQPPFVSSPGLQSR